MTAEFTRKLSEGELQIEAFFSSPSGFVAEQFARTGLDAVVVDLQHGAVGWSELISVLQAFELAGVSALVRTPSADPTEIARALDYGAAGLVVPMVSTVAQAAAIVQAMRYPPAGVRSFGHTRSAYNTVRAGTSPEKRWCLPMIETADGVANIDAILAIDGIDGVLVGPVDLSLAVGAPLTGRLEPALDTAIGVIADACRKATKVLVCAWFSQADLEPVLRFGTSLLIYGSDIYQMRAGAAQVRTAIDAAAKKVLES